MSSSSSSTLSSHIIGATPELLHAGCRSHILQRDGVQIHYITSTPPKNVDTGITLVLIHGWPEFWYAWRHLIVSLTAIGYHIIACDLRGMGESRVLDPSRRGDVSLYSWRQQCLDIIKILDHEKMQHAVAIGHDWGGAVVWSLVRRFPTRFTGVISLCTPYRPRKKKYFSTEEVAKVLPIFWYQVMFKNHRLRVASELNKDVPYTINCLFRTSDRSDQYGKFPTPTSPSFLHHFPSTIPRSRLHTDDEYQVYVEMWRAATFNESLLWYATDRVNWEEEGVAEDGKPPLSVRVEQPALMITAGKDMVLKAGQSDGMEEWIPKLSRGHVEESAHWIMSEQPKQVHDIIVKWLQSTQSAHQSRLVSKL